MAGPARVLATWSWLSERAARVLLVCGCCWASPSRRRLLSLLSAVPEDPREAGAGGLGLARRRDRASGTRWPTALVIDSYRPRRPASKEPNSRRSGPPGARVLSRRMPFRIRTFCAALMRVETVFRIGHPAGNLHRAGVYGTLRCGVWPRICTIPVGGSAGETPSSTRRPMSPVV